MIRTCGKLWTVSVVCAFFFTGATGWLSPTIETHSDDTVTSAINQKTMVDDVGSLSVSSTRAMSDDGSRSHEMTMSDLYISPTMKDMNEENETQTPRISAMEPLQPTVPSNDLTVSSVENESTATELLNSKRTKHQKVDDDTTGTTEHSRQIWDDVAVTMAEKEVMGNTGEVIPSVLEVGDVATNKPTFPSSEEETTVESSKTWSANLEQRSNVIQSSVTTLQTEEAYVDMMTLPDEEGTTAPSVSESDWENQTPSMNALPSVRIVRSAISTVDVAQHVSPTPASNFRSFQKTTTIQANHLQKRVGEPDSFHFLATPNSDGANGAATSEMVASPVISPMRKSDRKSNPDVKDIIDGIVKLLGGKVHVHAATEPVPFRDGNRPVNTRINNRGPPRITEVPFEAIPIEAIARPSLRPISPGTQSPTTSFGPPFPVGVGRPPLPSLQNPTPAQLPFQNGIPLPEQVVPIVGPHNHHPHGRPHRPTHTPPLLIPIRSDAAQQHTPVQVSTPLSPGQVNEAMKPTATKKTPGNKTTTTTTSAPPVDVPTRPTPTTPKWPAFPAPPANPVYEATTRKPPPVPPTQSAPVNNTDASITPPITTVPPHKIEKPDRPQPPDLESSIGDATTTVHSSSSSSSVTPPVPDVLFSTSVVNKPLSPAFPPALVSSVINTRPALTLHDAVVPTRHNQRPGIVLDDDPHDIIVGLAQPDSPPQVFDVTVTAQQNFGGGGNDGGHVKAPTGKPHVIPVGIEEILTSATGTEQFVSIDGKRTYFNLFPSRPHSMDATQVVGAGVNFGLGKPGVIGTGYVVPEPSSPNDGENARPPEPPVVQHGQRPPSRPLPSGPQGGVKLSSPGRSTTRRPLRRPSPPPVRIDTCIVGDSKTCDKDGYETCKTEQGVSSCVCRPGFGRRRHREPCSRVVALLVTMKVDRMGNHRLRWSKRYQDSSSAEYQELEWEAGHALDSAMSLTPMSTIYMGSRVNAFSSLSGHIAVNATLFLQQTPQTLIPAVKTSIQRNLLQVIQSRSNNIGESSLWVEGFSNPIPGLFDVNECKSEELNDCDPHATCNNVFGSFRCECALGYEDKYADDESRAGRHCDDTCTKDYCNGRGDCSIEDGQKICQCQKNFYGSQCEVDGEVLGVALGASITAVVIIILTLICLCMWSRRWKREQQKSELLSGRTGISPATYNYVTKGQGNTYHVTLEDRMRWAQIVDAVTTSTAASTVATGPATVPNLYAQPDPMGVNATRPSSAALFGTAPVFRLPRTPVPFPDMIGDDDDDPVGRGMKGARSKSRASLANQSGIYYDLDYDEAADMTNRSGGLGVAYGHHQMPIPLNTYVQNMGRPFYG